MNSDTKLVEVGLEKAIPLENLVDEPLNRRRLGGFISLRFRCDVFISSTVLSVSDPLIGAVLISITHCAGVGN